MGEVVDSDDHSIYIVEIDEYELGYSEAQAVGRLLIAIFIYF